MPPKPGPPNERPKPKSRLTELPPIKSQAVMVITIDKEGNLQVKLYGDGVAKEIVDGITLPAVRGGIEENFGMVKKLRTVWRMP